MSGGRGTFLRLVGTKVPLGLAVTLPSSARGVPEPVGGAGGSVSPPGGRASALGSLESPPWPPPAKPTQSSQLALVLFSAQLQRTEVLTMHSVLSASCRDLILPSKCLSGSG